MATPKKKTGRPTDYTPELLEKARSYVGGGWKAVGHTIPSHIGLGKYLGTSRDTLYDWASQEEKKEFSDILRQCMAEQQFALLNNGLDGTFNSAIAKLVLGKHGYHDKQDNTHSDRDGKPLNTILNITYRDAPKHE